MPALRPDAAARAFAAAPALLWAAIGAGGATIVVLWWRTTPPLSGAGALLTAAGQVAGLAGGYAVAMLLLVMARVPLLERTLGADRLARLHAQLGRWTVSVLVAHAVLITWGYAVSAHTGVLHQGWTLLGSYPDVLMATVALGLFVGVGVVSARAVRRRVAYETWYLLHLYTYLAVALSFSHQFATGAQFLDNLGARVVWGGMYAGVAAALLWWRVVVPLRTSWRQQLVVSNVVQERPDVVSVYLRGRDLSELEAQAGQFLRLRFLTRDAWWQSHPWSLSAAPDPRFLRVTIKSVGDHSAGLRSLALGTRVIAEGPYGSLTAARRSRRRVLLWAGGVGITPLRALLEALPAAAGDLTLIYRVGRDEDVIFAEELRVLAERRGATVHVVGGHRPAGGGDLLDPAGVARLVPDVGQRDVYLCGPPGMAAAARRTLSALGVPGRRIHSEDFGL